MKYFLLFLLIFTYPLAIFSPFGSSSSTPNVFDFRLDLFFLTGSLSCLYLLIKKKLSGNKLETLLWPIIFLLICNIYYTGSLVYKDFSVLFYFTIPLATYHYCKSEKAFKAELYFALSGMLVINLFICYIFNKKIGISANHNWLSGAVLCSSPCLAVVLNNVATIKSFNQHKYFTATFCLIIVTPVLYWADSRASLLALLSFLPAFIFFKYGYKAKLVIILSTFLLGFTLIKSFPHKVERISARDIRLPLWEKTVLMIQDAPLLGHGAGEYERAASNYINDSASKRLVYASASEHPHNEVLHLASTVGVVIALFWLALIYFTFSAIKENKEAYIPFFIAWVLFIQGMLDKNLVEAPGNIIFPLCLGYLYYLKGCDGEKIPESF